jgi:hypothetical protein
MLPNTIEARIFFCRRQLNGSMQAVTDGRQLREFPVGLKGVSRDLKIDQNGRCMSPNLTVPFPAMLRSVSGRRKIIKTMMVAANMKMTQKIDRKPRNWVRAPPMTGLMKWLPIKTGKH